MSEVIAQFVIEGFKAFFFGYGVTYFFIHRMVELSKLWEGGHGGMGFDDDDDTWADPEKFYLLDRGRITTSFQIALQGYCLPKKPTTIIPSDVVYIYRKKDLGHETAQNPQ